MVLLFIDNEGLLTLQKMYDMFIFQQEGSTKTYLKELPFSYRPLQESKKYRSKTLDLYDRLFATADIQEIMSIITESNQLASRMAAEFGDFFLEDEFNKIDYLDETLLLDMVADYAKAS